MPIPIIYNVRSVKARWTSTIVAVAGIAGTVGVFIAMLSLARGFRATLVSSGSADNASRNRSRGWMLRLILGVLKCMGITIRGPIESSSAGISG